MTRTSTVTGRRYVDDPTILAWCEGPPAQRVCARLRATQQAAHMPVALAHRRFFWLNVSLRRELLNEPRAAVSYAGGGDYERSRGLPPGKIICDWVAEMSSFIK